MDYILFPWKQLGTILRELSLSGGFGNGVSWTLFFAVGILPLGAACLLRLRRKNCRADFLLVVLSAMLYADTWFFANPSYLDLYLSPMPMDGFSGYLLVGVTDSLLLVWILLRTVRHCEKAEYLGLLSGLRLLLCLYILILALGSLWRDGSAFLDDFTALQGNTLEVSNARFGLSVFVLILQTIVKLLPPLSEAALLAMAVSFLYSFGKESFGPRSCGKLERLRIASGHLLALILVSNVGVSLLQLLLARWILNSSHLIYLPLTEIIAVLGIRMLSYLFLESRRLKEDNEMFI